MAGGVVHAQVTPLDWYHMGEGDGLTVAGQALTTTVDTIGTKALLLEGNVLVATDIGASAVSSLGSTRSLHFSTAGTDYGHTTSVLTTTTDNFGLEAWVKPTSASSADQTIVYNGRPGSNGWGIVLKSGTTFQAQFGPVVFGSATATIGTWTHVAVVRDNGIARFYVNGADVSGPEFTVPTTPTLGFGVGNGIPSFDTGLQGFVDEVRVFTLSPGNFSSTQLLLGAKRASNTLDSGAGSLRAALASAVPGDTISISATGTITLASPLPVITSGVYIYGLGASNLSVSGGNAHRVFFVDLPDDSPTSLLVGDLSIANGAATGGAGGDGGWGGGGGLGAGGGLFVNAGNVVLSRVNFSGNAATGGKGGKSNGSGCGCKGGGGGLGGAGGSATGSNAAGGGGGFRGNGGSAPNNTGSGGGGGITGNGGSGGAASGGGGGAFTAGANANNLIGGAGADGIGGNGATFGSSPPYDGVDGLEYGGGGGGAEPGNGGNGGRYGGGGGSSEVAGGAGGDFGGSGGGGISGVPTPGGFGGGSGGVAVQNNSGAGGFGGGTGGSDSVGGGAPGAFAGHGGVAVGGAGGGGGAALGGAIFVRASNGATLTWNDGSADFGSVTAGAGGTGSGGNGAGNPGSTSGSAMFLLGGTTTFNVSSGQQSILGSIGGWSSQPPNITKTGTGTLVLPGGGSDLGTITVSKGDLRVSFEALNLAATKELDVNSTATLSGLLGTIGGPVKLASGGTISPGDPANASGVGTLSIGDLTWNGGGVVAHQLGPSGGIDSDLLLVNGSLVKSGSGSYKFAFTDGDPGPICGTTYTLIHYTGANGFAAGDFTFTYSGASGVAPDSAFAIDGAGGNVQFTAHCFTDQAITNFASTPANPAYADGGTFLVDATPGGSTSPLAFGSDTPSVCTVSGSIVTMHARGVCTLTANQAGDSLRNPAPTVFLTRHFEQFTVGASASTAHGTIDPPSQTIDYGAAAAFTVVADSGYVAVLGGDTCTVTHATGNTWTSGPITGDCTVTAEFIDRVFADGFEPGP